MRAGFKFILAAASLFAHGQSFTLMPRVMAARSLNSGLTLSLSAVDVTSPADANWKEEKSTNLSKLVRVGVIGCGRIGLVHLGAIQKVPGCQVVVVSNPTVSKAESAALNFGVPRFTADAVDVITDPDVDAVWICSPSNVHAEQIKLAAENGKHVFCEKVSRRKYSTFPASSVCSQAHLALHVSSAHCYIPPGDRRGHQRLFRGRREAYDWPAEEVSMCETRGCTLITDIVSLFSGLTPTSCASRPPSRTGRLETRSWSRCARETPSLLPSSTSRVAAASLPTWPCTTST